VLSSLQVFRQILHESLISHTHATSLYPSHPPQFGLPNNLWSVNLWNSSLYALRHVAKSHSQQTLDFGFSRGFPPRQGSVSVFLPVSKNPVDCTKRTFHCIISSWRSDDAVGQPARLESRSVEPMSAVWWVSLWCQCAAVDVRWVSRLTFTETGTNE
jgi:hypothetical protein